MADIDTTDTPAPDPTGTTGPRRWPWLVLLLALFAVGARWGYLSLRAEDADRARIGLLMAGHAASET